MRSIVNTIIGRKPISPLEIHDVGTFVEFLEQNAKRIDSRSKLQVPFRSRGKGFVFFEDDDLMMIRYNAGGLISLTSLCFFSGRIETHGDVATLVGQYRFPWFIELPKYLVLVFAVIWVFYFANRLFFHSPLPGIDWLVWVLGLGVFALAGTFFGNVSASFFARKMITKVNSLLARYSASPRARTVGLKSGTTERKKGSE